MPEYNFRCKNCDRNFSVRTSISERHQVKCPQCGGANLQQVFAPVGIQVKTEKPTCDLSCGANKRYG